MERSMASRGTGFVGENWACARPRAHIAGIVEYLSAL